MDQPIERIVKAVNRDRSSKKVSTDQIMAAIESGDYIGFCIACGFEQEGCEPDARGYECESCGASKVYGAEELLVMGY